MKTSIRRRALTGAALLALTAGTLTACGQDETADFDDAEQPAGTETETQPAPEDKEPPTQTEPATDDAEDDTDAAPSSAGTVGPQDARDTIVYELPGADERAEATVTVGLHDLRVEGEVMRLELSFTPEFNGDGTYGIFDLNDAGRLAPVLNDRANLKQYTVLQDGSDEWATGTNYSDPKVASGQTLRYWGYFAAPEDDIDTISVGVGMVEFDDVEITR